MAKRRTRSHKKTSKHMRMRMRKNHSRKSLRHRGGDKADYLYAYASNPNTKGGESEFYISPMIQMMEEDKIKNKRGGARDVDPNPSCNYQGQINNRNNLAYFPYLARGKLNSGFQQGEISQSSSPVVEGFSFKSLLSDNISHGGKRRYRRTMKAKAKRGGGCGGQSRDSWFRGAYPVLLV